MKTRTSLPKTVFSFTKICTALSSHQPFSSFEKYHPGRESKSFSLVRRARILEGRYEDFTSPTTGAMFHMLPVNASDGSSIILQLWDTAGQERYRAVSAQIFRGAHIAVICHDPSDLTAVTTWAGSAREYAPFSKLFLVLTKADCYEKAQIADDQTALAKFAEDNEAPLFNTSAREGLGIDELVAALTECGARCLAQEQTREELTEKTVKGDNCC
jgi:GTPase SAR1 family protein